MDEVLMIPGVPGSSGRGVGGATSAQIQIADIC